MATDNFSGWRLALAQIRSPLIGNVKVMVWTSEFWIIPSAVIANYQSVYFRDLGLTVHQIGLVVGISWASQILWNVPGAWLAHKLGKKRAVILADFLGWVIGSFLMAYVRTPMTVLIGMTVYNLWVLGNAAHECILVDETASEAMRNLFLVRNSLSSLTALVTVPVVAYLFLRPVGLVTGMRWMYVTLGCAVIVALLIRSRALHEPKTKMKETSFTETIVGLNILIKSGRIRRVLTLKAVIQGTQSAVDTYFPLFALQLHGMNIGILSFYTLWLGFGSLFSIAIAGKMSRWSSSRAAFLGTVLRMMGWITVFGIRSWVGAVGYMIFGGFGRALAIPSLSALWANTIPADKRAVAYAGGNMVITAMQALAVVIGGLLLTRGLGTLLIPAFIGVLLCLPGLLALDH